MASQSKTPATGLDPLVGCRVEFLADAPPAFSGDCGTVVGLRTLPGGHDVVMVNWHGTTIATFRSEIRLVTA